MASSTKYGPYPASERRPANTDLLLLPLTILIVLGLIALGYVIYVLWPRWPEEPVPANAPALPIVVGGTLFNVPQSALRIPVQRRAGTQERIDLVFRWPTPATTSTSTSDALVFVTISAASAELLSPSERLKNLYPQYLLSDQQAISDGLTAISFRDDTPYRGEDLVYNAVSPDHFAARCTRENKKLTPAICLAERRLGNTDILLRFPRSWLNDWQSVAAGFDRLIDQLQQPARSK